MLRSFLKDHIRPLVGLAALVLAFAAGQSAASAAAVDTTQEGQAARLCAAKHGAVAYRLGTLFGVSGQIFEWKVVGKNYPGDIGLTFSNYTCFDDVYVLQGAKYPGLVVLNYGDMLEIQGVTKVASLGEATKECSSKNNHLAKHRMSKDGKDDFTEVVAFGERPVPGNPNAGDSVYLPMATESSKLAAFAAPSTSSPKVLYGCLGELTWAVTSVPIVSYDEYEAKVLALAKPAPVISPTPCDYPAGATYNLDIKLQQHQAADRKECRIATAQIKSYTDAGGKLGFTMLNGSVVPPITTADILSVSFNGNTLTTQQLTLALTQLNTGGTSGGGSTLPAWISKTPLTCTAVNGPNVWVSLFSPQFKVFMLQSSSNYGQGPGGYACKATAVSNGFSQSPV
jgi:hypothetical protein